MPIARLIFEEGVELVAAVGGWRTVGSTEQLTFPSRHAIEAALAPRRTVLVVDGRQDGSSLSLLLNRTTKEYYPLAVSSLTSGPLAAEHAFDILNIAYVLGAVGYHCTRLAELYAGVVNQFARMTRISGFGNETAASFGHQAGPYYEFDALLGAARRCYDSTRYLLWKKFGSKGTMPSSLARLLASGPDLLPAPLFELLSDSWQNHGVALTAYRDCVHHYVPVDDVLASASMLRMPSGIWTARMRIPDNPEARSRDRFKFAKNIDALTFCWVLADEILKVVRAVVAEVASHADA